MQFSPNAINSNVKNRFVKHSLVTQRIVF